jgi:hypothetical protein
VKKFFFVFQSHPPKKLNVGEKLDFNKFFRIDFLSHHLSGQAINFLIQCFNFYWISTNIRGLGLDWLGRVRSG